MTKRDASPNDRATVLARYWQRGGTFAKLPNDLTTVIACYWQQGVLPLGGRS
ncbi:hypothetical protein [Parabacteroides sp. FAFU027]|uniref:hypothetical protein n=1 Tax=Parabacteroides sp. FAFU027 TaxID=2922715 RepID=UPI001FAF82CF|nr:hypothetical protein [Parabacteroides sp. FAFU027]